MNTRLFFLPALALGGAALLVFPSRDSRAFSTIGGSLSEAQRDVRVFCRILRNLLQGNVVHPPLILAFTNQVRDWNGSMVQVSPGEVIQAVIPCA